MDTETTNKINTAASRDAVRARYGSVRQFARVCMDVYSLANIDAAYSLVGKVLGNKMGYSVQRHSIARAIRKRLADEALLVYEEGHAETPKKRAND